MGNDICVIPTSPFVPGKLKKLEQFFSPAVHKLLQKIMVQLGAMLNVASKLSLHARYPSVFGPVQCNLKFHTKSVSCNVSNIEN